MSDVFVGGKAITGQFVITELRDPHSGEVLLGITCPDGAAFALDLVSAHNLANALLKACGMVEQRRQ